MDKQFVRLVKESIYLVVHEMGLICGFSTATIEYSSLSVCLCVSVSVCLSVYTITQKIMVQST